MRLLESTIKSFAAIALLGALLAPSAFAISEANYGSEFAQNVRPFFDRGDRDTFAGVNGVPIHFVSFVNPEARATIVIASGFMESTEKYAEAIYDLYRAGYSVHMADHRGQGHSGRLIADRTLGYIDRFDYFAIDLHQFVNQVVKPRSPPDSPLFLLAHSMGGAVGARYLQIFPNDFRVAALSAPMLGVNLGGWEPHLAKSILHGLLFLGKGEAIAMGKQRVDLRAEPFEKNTITHSRARHRMVRDTWKRDPGLAVEAPTNAWVLRSIEAGEKAVRRAKQIRTPLLILQASEDSFVMPAPQEIFCRQAADCRLERVPGARHELLMESDRYRDDAFREILGFFAIHAR